MAWQLLGSTKLTSTGDTVEVAGFSAKKFLYVELHKIGANVNPTMTFNSDGGSNYTRRYSPNGGSDVTNLNDTKLEFTYAGATPTSFAVLYIINVEDQEKQIIIHDGEENSSGSGSAPNRMEVVGKWANTSDSITTVTFGNDDSGDYDVGSEAIVWGTD